MLDLSKLQAPQAKIWHRSGKDLKAMSEAASISSARCNHPSGDKKQTFWQDSHHQLSSLHPEVVSQDTMTNCP